MNPLHRFWQLNTTAMVQSRPILILAFMWILLAPRATAQEVRARFVEEICIGCEEDLPLEALLQSPDQVEVDEEGRIYISERRLNVIRVFDGEGKYIKTLGGDGQGPGEFREISSMMIDRDGALLVMDWSNQRMTRFSDLGESVATTPWSGEAGARADFLFPLDEKYLFVYGWRDESSPHGGRIFHVHSSDLQQVEASFGAMPLFYDLDDPLGRAGARGMGAGEWLASVDGRGRVFFVTGAYDGLVYRLTRQEGDVWKVDRLRGYGTPHPAYEQIDIDVYRRDEPRFGFATHSRDGSYAGRMFNFSVGLHALSDGSVVHFFMIPPEGDVDALERVLGMERFDSRGRSLGHAFLEPPSSTRFTFVPAVDKSGRFYVLERSRESPSVLRRVRLEIR